MDEVKDIRDKAEAMAAYARQAKDSELIQYATEIKVRAERRCGELLAKTPKNTGVRVAGGVVVERCDHQQTPTLAQMGLTKDESSRYQQLAAMPADVAYLGRRIASNHCVGSEMSDSKCKCSSR